MTTKESMHIDPYERAWIGVSIVLLVVFMVAIGVAGFALGIQVPSPEQRVDPRTVATDPKAPGQTRDYGNCPPANTKLMSWHKPGLFCRVKLRCQLAPTVTFYVTSKDVQHGFKIQDTNVNMQIVPGQVSKLEITFDEAGRYDYICTEYCGAAHAIMYGTVIVEP